VNQEQLLYSILTTFKLIILPLIDLVVVVVMVVNDVLVVDVIVVDRVVGVFIASNIPVPEISSICMSCTPNNFTKKRIPNFRAFLNNLTFVTKAVITPLLSQLQGWLGWQKNGTIL
jgi:hypothetical protein